MDSEIGRLDYFEVKAAELSVCVIADVDRIVLNSGLGRSNVRGNNFEVVMTSRLNASAGSMSEASISTHETE